MKVQTATMTPYKRGKDYFIKMYGTEYRLILEEQTDVETKKGSSETKGESKKSAKKKGSQKILVD